MNKLGYFKIGTILSSLGWFLGAIGAGAVEVSTGKAWAWGPQVATAGIIIAGLGLSAVAYALFFEEKD